MSLWSVMLAGLVLLAVAVIFRRFQARRARLARADELATAILARPHDAANRQELADIMRAWEDLSVFRQEALVAHLAQHPRLNGVDVTNTKSRQRTYEVLVGISAGKSPEK